MLRLLGILALGNMIFGGNRRCRNGSLPGSLFLLPALMFGGWIAVAVVGGVLSMIGTIIGGVFSGLSALASGVFSGSGLVLGIVIGLVLFYAFRNKKRNEPASTVDGEEVETTIEEPMHYEQRNSRGY